MIFTYVIVFLFVVLIVVFALYFATVYLSPRKLDEIADMIEKGQIKLAIKKLEETLAKDERNSYAHLLMAKAFLAEQNTQYAIVEYRQVLKIAHFDDKVKEPEVRNQLAKLLKSQKALDEAKKEFLILTKIDPDNFENYFELGELFFNAGVMDKAAAYLRKCIQLNPQHDKAFYYLGQVFYKSGNFAEAKNAFIEVIKRDQGNYKAHYFLGLVLRHIGDIEWAIKEFDIAQKEQELKVKCFLAKGTCYFEKEQFPKAIIEFERGLKVAKHGSDTELNLRYYLASTHEGLRDLHSAISHWERINEVNKNFRDVAEKLKKYSEFRQDDHIKDFMIAGLAHFEHTCRKMVETMGFTIQDVNIISDTDIEIVATETEGKWRNARKTNRIIRIIRTTGSVNDSLLRQLHEAMRPKNASRVMIISTGDFNKASVDFANTRPIDLIGKAELVELLKKVNS